MKLLRVHLHGFGAFNKGLEVKFAPDKLNLVVGRNEAGKSTLLAGIVGVFFGFRDLNLVRKFEPWDDHDAYAGEVEILTDDGRHLRIHRDFKTQNATVHELGGAGDKILFEGSADPRGTRDEDQTYFEVLGTLLGFQDESVFRSTVFLGQQNLKTSVSDQVRRLLSGSSSTDYKGALHELHSRYAELTTENPWRTKTPARRRLIEETTAELEADRRRLGDGRRAMTRSVELDQELEALTQELTQGELDVETSKANAGALETQQSLLSRKEESERRFKDAVQRRDNFRRYLDRAAEIEDRIQKEFARFQKTPDDFPELVRKHATAVSEHQREVSALTHEKKNLAELKPLPNNRSGVLFGVVLSAILAAVLSATALSGPSALILAAIAFPVGWAIGRQVGTGFAAQKTTLANRIAELEVQCSAHKKRADEVVAQVGPQFLGADPEDVLKQHRAYKELREEKKRLQAAGKALGSKETIEAEFEEASREQGAVASGFAAQRELSAEIAAMTDRALVARRLDEMRTSVNTGHAMLTRKRERQESIKVERAGLTARMDFDLPDLVESVREKETRLKGYDIERDALKEAIDVLDHCVKDFQESDAFRLSEEISGLFAKITDDKYTRVQLGASLDPIVSRGDRIPIAPTDLSQGAQDQLYFAMRVAMARHLSRNIRLPLFLDDPFVNFDAQRLNVTKEVLDHLQGQQIIMVTCNRDYESWTDAKIDLDLAKRN